MPDLRLGELTRPQCGVPDLHRELGSLFHVALSPHNRQAGTEVLRERWQSHIDARLRAGAGRGPRAALARHPAPEAPAAVHLELYPEQARPPPCLGLCVIVTSGKMGGNGAGSRAVAEPAVAGQPPRSAVPASDRAAYRYVAQRGLRPQPNSSLAKREEVTEEESTRFENERLMEINSALQGLKTDAALGEDQVRFRLA